MQGQHFGNLRADSHHRIERGHRLLEHHADFAAAQLPQTARRGLQNVFAVEIQTAFQGKVGIEPHDALRENGFTAAAFADNGGFSPTPDFAADAGQHFPAAERGSQVFNL